jgi:hypothetical protein
MTTAIVKPRWSPISIGLMVLGFIVWWPLGLAVLAYILWGECFGGSAERAEAWVDRQRSWARERRYKARYRHRHGATGNRAFDEYRDAELQRLEEERRRLEEEREEFADFLRNLQMARDREEFDRFMAERETRHGDADRREKKRRDEED